ncbi:hypothetical protein GGP41_009562 [Bipolaris sorokiniana]|jgi:hypothetical protein|uniref:DASH complex subunit DAD2 n=1 Tax=Cochliobolus sativus TaxID=45130 RepID=A0A8H5ZAL3_COCSA|nr:hypothetical protein GGP41_009562 [Bipolaris sorokiniana]
MSNFGRPLPSHLRNQSLGGSQQQSPVLLARIAEKKAELANLKDLQALSGGLADQMQMLADKLSTLSDGTEGMFELNLAGFAHADEGKASWRSQADIEAQRLQQYCRIGTTY